MLGGLFLLRNTTGVIAFIVVNRDRRTQTPRRPNPNRRAIHATCRTHGGCIGFTNLVVTKRDGVIELDPHVTGQCVITLAEDAARVLHEALGEWLG